jgi:hypothetical protein
MSKGIDGTFARPVGIEALLVIAYIAGLIFFSLAWTKFNAPPNKAELLANAAARKNQSYRLEHGPDNDMVNLRNRTSR